MSIIVCGQGDIGSAFACIECEGPLPGSGFAAEIGRVCSEDCAADQSAQRDLLCDCADYCTPAGLPTAGMRQEYADYKATSGGEPA